MDCFGKIHNKVRWLRFYLHGCLDVGTSIRLFTLIVAASFLVGQQSSVGQLTLPESPPPTTPPAVAAGAQEPTQETLETDLGAAQADVSLSDEQKATITSLYQSAKQSLQTAEAIKKSIERFQSMSESAASDKRALELQIASAEQSELEIPSDATIAWLSDQLLSTNAELKSANSKVTELAGEPSRRRTRLTEIPAEISKAEDALQGLQEQQAQPPAANEVRQETLARQSLAKARAAELQLRIAALKEEQNAYSTTTEVLPLRAKLADATVQRITRQAERLQNLLSEAQRKKAMDTTSDQQRAAESVPVALKELADENLEYAKAQSKLLADSEKAATTLTETQKAYEDVKAEIKTSEARIKSIGLTEALGLLLREKKKGFEELRSRFRPNERLRQTTQQHEIESYQLEDELQDVKRQLAEREELDFDWTVEPIRWSRLSEADAKTVILKRRKQLIEEQLKTQNALLQNMLTGEHETRELRQAIDRFNAMVDRHLFWTRSAPALSISEFGQYSRLLSWFFDRQNWRRVGQAMVLTVRRYPVTSGMLIVLFFALVYARPKLRRILSEQGAVTNRVTSTFRNTSISLAATVGSAAVWPVGWLLFSFLIGRHSEGDPFLTGLSNGFVTLSLFVASRDFLKDVCRPDGLANRHFGWSDGVRDLLRKHLRWYTVVGGISIFLLVTLHEYPDATVRSAGLRITSVSVFLMMATFHHLIVRKRSQILIQIASTNPESVLYRGRAFLWAFSVLPLIVLAAMSLLGYLETTYRISRLLQSTYILVVTIIVMVGVVYRWLTLNRRDMARKKAMEAREKRAAAEDPDGESIASQAGIVLEDEDDQYLPNLDSQTRHATTVLAFAALLIGVSILWRDILPAFEYFDQATLYSVGSGEDIKVVSYLDLFNAIIGLFALIFATKTFPGMLELLVLSRTKFDSGARYALATLFRYAIIVAGSILLLNLLAVPYDQLGWLLAAISVGLGFGLQEIVANFVSGIILLLERPVRVGDIVTIDGTSGVVSRIQMRATTVTNWDRQELVIPNKDLITQKLLNWTLSNVVNRLTIRVGVAYGTDPDQVREILFDVVRSHPEVLEDPGPLINFETFGDSALDFVVRLYLPKLDNRIEVTHQINTEIARRLEKAGIEIPFPQRDVHLDVTAVSDLVPIEIARGQAKGDV